MSFSFSVLFSSSHLPSSSRHDTLNTNWYFEDKLILLELGIFPVDHATMWAMHFICEIELVGMLSSKLLVK